MVVSPENGIHRVSQQPTSSPHVFNRNDAQMAVPLPVAVHTGVLSWSCALYVPQDLGETFDLPHGRNLVDSDMLSDTKYIYFYKICWTRFSSILFY